MAVEVPAIRGPCWRDRVEWSGSLSATARTAASAKNCNVKMVNNDRVLECNRKLLKRNRIHSLWLEVLSSLPVVASIFHEID